MRKSIKLLTILLLASELLASCGNAETAGNKADNSIYKNVSTDEKTGESEADVEENTSDTQEDKKNSELPKFKKGEDYKSVRKKLTEAGWTPFTSPEADKCYGDDERCKDYPEMENCAGTGLGNCRYLWIKHGKTLVIFTVGESPVYDGQELKKAEKPSESNGITGKYVYRYEHDSGYDEFVYVLKPKGVATFKSVREGGDGRDLTGTWAESEGVISVVFKNEEGKAEETEFALEKGSLKQLSDPEANENYRGFVGTIFKKK